VLRQTSPDDLSVEEFPIYIYHTWDISCRSLQYIPGNKQSHSIGLTDCKSQDRWNHLQLGCILSRMCMLTVIHSLVTYSLLYIPQEFPLFVIIFLTFSTPASHGSTNTSAWCDSFWIEPNGGRFIQCAPRWDTAATQISVSLPRRCNCSHRKYGPGSTFKNSTENRMQQW
jgi:hypothetical protein